MDRASPIALALCLSASIAALASAATAQPSQLIQVSQDIQDIEDDVAPEPDIDDEIIARSNRLPGLALSNIEPELVLSEADIQAYGVSSLGELLAELEVETGSSRGRGGGGGPVVLLNGRRISGFREIGRYPTEAIRSVEILPEEAALRFGYRADQRVINFILKDNFTATTVEQEWDVPNEGDRTTTETELGWLWINGQNRANIDGELTTAPFLLESDRNIDLNETAQPYDSIGNITSAVSGDEIDAALSAFAGEPVTVASVPEEAATTLTAIEDYLDGANETRITDDRGFRSLADDQESLDIRAGLTRTLFGDTTGTLSVGYEDSQSTSLLGLATADIEIDDGNGFSPFSEDIILYRYLPELGTQTRESDTTDTNLGLAVTSGPGDVQWTLTGNFSDRETETITDRGVDNDALNDLINDPNSAVNPFGSLAGVIDLERERSISELQTGTLELVVNTQLPLGADRDASLTLKGGGQYRDQETRTTDSDGRTETSLSRDQLDAQISFDVPVFADETLFVNGNFAVDDLSDFGTLYTYGGGINWKPIEGLTIVASYTKEDGAPDIGELGNPIITTPNTRVFDFQTGETVFVDSITGGNPGLIADEREVTSFTVTYRRGDRRTRSWTVSSVYTDNALTNQVASFPEPTVEIEAAFPDRFTRDADGTLLAIDRRPVNFDSSSRQTIRTQFSLFTSIRRGQQAGGGSGRPPSPNAGGGRPPGAQPGAGQQGFTPPPGFDFCSVPRERVPENRRAIYDQRCSGEGEGTAPQATLPQSAEGGFTPPPGFDICSVPRERVPENRRAMFDERCGAEGETAPPTGASEDGDQPARPPQGPPQGFTPPPGFDVCSIPRERVPENRRAMFDQRCGAEGQSPQTQAQAAPGEGQPPAGRPQGGPAAQQGARGAGGRPPAARGGGSPFGRGPQGGRLRLTVQHLYTLEDEIVIGDGVPTLDLLNGSATGSRGGTSEHTISVNSGFFMDGIGGRLNARWQSETEVLIDPQSNVGDADDLFFDAFTTVNGGVFVDLGQRQGLTERYPFFQNARISFDVNNIFDETLSVRNRDGERPANYQPDLLDPFGRTYSFSLRKVF